MAIDGLPPTDQTTTASAATSTAQAKTTEAKESGRKWAVLSSAGKFASIAIEKIVSCAIGAFNKIAPNSTPREQRAEPQSVAIDNRQASVLKEATAKKTITQEEAGGIKVGGEKIKLGEEISRNQMKRMEEIVHTKEKVFQNGNLVILQVTDEFGKTFYHLDRIKDGAESNSPTLEENGKIDLKKREKGSQDSVQIFGLRETRVKFTR